MTSADEMRDLFARWKESGQSLLAFGKTEGVAHAKLLYWRRKLGDEERRKPRGSVSPLVPVRVVAEELDLAPEIRPTRS